MPDKRLSDEITVVAGLAASVGNYARSRGIDIAPICKALDINPATFDSLTERISLDRLCRLLETCALISGDDTFGLQCASTFPAGASGAFGYGLISARRCGLSCGFFRTTFITRPITAISPWWLMTRR